MQQTNSQTSRCVMTWIPFADVFEHSQRLEICTKVELVDAGHLHSHPVSIQSLLPPELLVPNEDARTNKRMRRFSVPHFVLLGGTCQITTQ